MVHHHFLLVTFPAQGHINPSLQFAKRLVRAGAQVTYVTSVSVHRRIANKTATQGLTLAAFSDGYDDGYNPDGDVDHYLSELKRRGSESIAEMITSRAENSLPFTGVIYTLLLSWVADVAREFHLPSTLLWIQPATVLDIFYYYFNGYEHVIRDKSNDPSFSINLPGLPTLTSRDLPSFLLPSNKYTFGIPSFKEQLEALKREMSPRLLVNTFDELEPEALTAIRELNPRAIGPLIPSAFLDGEDPSDKSFGGDLFQRSSDYIEWLNSKPDSSTIYVSFGSISVLSKHQMEEIARCLLDIGRPFLWVIRETKDAEKLCCLEELEQKGKIVRWCSQVEVLSHPSLGCFVTHCGWNSTLESIASGVPVVAFPQWADQGTNAKMVEDVWKVGVRVKVNEEGIVEGEELRRCLELVMVGGEEEEEMRRNSKKWKDLAREAVKEGGSSDKNLKAFVDEIGRCYC